MTSIIAVSLLTLGSVAERGTTGAAQGPADRIVIGTTTSPGVEHADLIADGRDDGEQLRQAFARLGVDGGTVVLLAGRYRLDSSTPVQVPSRTTLDGRRPASHRGR